MNIEAELKKDGIEIIGRLDTLSVNSLAKNVSDKICKAFPKAHFNSNELFIEFARLPMFLAKMPEGFAEANYFYKNSSIYFKQGVPLDELEKFAIHEFIHHLQEVKDKNGDLCRLGLCEYSEFKTYGMALNEGAVQLLTSKVLKQPEDIVKYYEISLPTNSPNYYPLLCNLVKQLTYLIGEDTLFESTFFSTDNFKLEAIRLLGRREFLKIQENLDKILYIEEKIIKLNNQLLEDKCDNAKAQKIGMKIYNYKTNLRKAFIQTQDLIFSSYFNNEFNNLSTTQEIEIYRTKLYNYQNYLGITENYFDFNNYYVDKMAALENKYESIINNVALTVVKESKLANLFKALRLLFSFGKNENENE